MRGRHNPAVKLCGLSPILGHRITDIVTARAIDA